jgi:hypothetical protein
MSGLQSICKPYPIPMIKQSIACILLLFCISAKAQNKTYYISAAGNDANDGLSTVTAWQTLSPVNNLNLKPGDKVLLQGGQLFAGFLELNESDVGTATNPVIISSYGGGKAIINPSAHSAISVSNTGGLRISNIILHGDGSNYDGIKVLINQTNADLDFIQLDSMEVTGFGGRGCLIGAYSTDKGFNMVTVEHSSFHDNNVAGLETFGAWPAFSHTDFTIRYCKFYNNTGNFSTSVNTGNGMVISGVDGALVEYCEAYNNGSNNRSSGGGPVGIWVYDAKNVTIQYCESHHNKAGLTKDGGGFDLDGGSQYCIIQYCYSHDNEGYGMALVEYGSPNEFTGNVIRYNISQNDGRKNSYGAIVLYAVDAAHPVKSSEVYNNTIYTDANNLVNGKPSVVNILSQNFSGVKIRNNIFYANPGIDLINSLFSLAASELLFENNNYYSPVSAYDFWWNGIHYTSLDDWKIAAAGQEVNGGITAIQNPYLVDPGTGSIISPADGGNFNSLFGYTLNPFSPLVDKALELDNMGNRDFFGKALPLASGYDVGASEAIPVSVLPLNITSFTSVSEKESTLLQWKVENEEYLEKYEVQKSFDGNSFHTIAQMPAQGKIIYSFSDNEQRLGPTTFYRIHYIYPNGRSGFSKNIRAFKTGAKEPRVSYAEGEGAQLQLYSDSNKKVVISSYSTNGSLVYSSSSNLFKGYNTIRIYEAAQWKPGIYFIQIMGDCPVVARLSK